MASASITVRVTKAGGRRFAVRYRLGGRAYPIVHGGSFKTLKEARARRDLIAGELANGRNPARLLQALATEPTTPTVITLNEWAERFLTARIDIDTNTKKNYRSALRRIGETFGDRDPSTITATEIAEWIAALATTRKPGTLGQYLIAFRLLLDHAGVEPNPARDPRVKLPKHVREEPSPPSAEHVLAILEALRPDPPTPVRGDRAGCAPGGRGGPAALGDVDRPGLRLRLPRSATKRDKARWVYLPEWLIDSIEATCPLEDRTPDRRVFQGVTEATAYQTMTRACQTAGVPHYHPHDLRHRRITIWHQSGSRRESSRNEQDTRGRRCRSTCTRT